MNWQSSRVKPPTLSRATSQASATFDASVIAAEHAFAEEGAAELHAVEPADQLVRQASTSIEWAWPIAWSASVARSISVLIQVSSRSAQALITAAKVAVAGDREAA